MTPTADLLLQGSAAVIGNGGVPRGPRGLWGALVNASTPRLVERALPVTDTTRIGTTAPSAMFDYDPALAVSLGEEFDPVTLLG